MKRIYKLLSLMLLAAFVFSSCNSGLSITKRRYTKGYYVHHSQKASEPKTKETARAVKSKGKESVALKQVVAGKMESEPTGTDEQNVLTASAATKKTESSSFSNATGTIMTAITNPAKSFKDLTDKINASPASSEALSLLWILILILLIAWIAGILLDNFGLGWVIHILLVVALVLLILWLLRIL